jgi:GT2 family glycosyltransferase
LNWVRFFISEKSIGASAARHQIYPLSKSEILIGFDDDAHPLTRNFIWEIEVLFHANPKLGILAFEEIKGEFSSDEEAYKQSENKHIEFFCSEFIGSGFAIRKSVYDMTNGFPVWIDIYGEESCLSIEVVAEGFDILYTNAIKVNHRVNIAERKLNKQNYFRFEKQLKNTTFYYLVYYPYPLPKIIRLYLHNFKKYALTDWHYFNLFFKTIVVVFSKVSTILKFRAPVNSGILLKMKQLSNPKF